MVPSKLMGVRWDGRSSLVAELRKMVSTQNKVDTTQVPGNMTS